MLTLTRRKRRTMTKKNADKLKHLAAAYAQAWVDKSWASGGDPESIPEIDHRLERARRRLFEFIDNITDQTNAPENCDEDISQDPRQPHCR